MSDVTPALPFLPPWYRVAVTAGKVVLEYGQRLICLEGGAADRLVPALLPLLDGTRTVDEIVCVLGEPARSAIENALAELTSHGLLLEGPPLPAGVPRPVSGAVQLLASLLPAAAPLPETAASVVACSVAVVGDSGAGVEVARLLRLSGVETERAESVAPAFDLTVCAPAPAELPLLREWNRQALEARAPWLQVLPFDGRYASVGPLYLPGDTCCYECFRLRRAANLDGVDDELSWLEHAPASYPTAPGIDAVAGGLAAMLALGWLVLGDHHAPAAFYAFELLPLLAMGVHHVHRVPRCPACSGLEDIAGPLPWHKEIPVASG